MVTQDATKQFTLDELPPVLILHLKRFLYDEHVGSQKCTKKIGYGTHLRIDERIMGPAHTRRNNLATGAGAGGGGNNGKGKEVARYELFGGESYLFSNSRITNENEKTDSLARCFQSFIITVYNLLEVITL